jgi:hypothetical protein
VSWGDCDDCQNPLAVHLDPNTGGQTVTAGTDGFVLFAGGVNSKSILTTETGQYIIVFFTVTRSNTSAAGAGRYEVWIDGAWVGASHGAIILTADQEQATYTGFQRLQIATNGSHTVQIRCFATTGDEVLVSPMSLMIMGAEAA